MAAGNIRRFVPIGGGAKGRFKEVEKAENVGATLKRLVVYFRSEGKLLLGMVVTVVATALLGLLAPALQSNAIDIVAGSRDGALKVVLAAMVGTYALNAVGRLVQSRLSAFLSQNIVKKMRGDLFDCVVDLPIGYVDNHSHGDLMSRMTNDIETISNTISQSFVSLISGALTIIGTVVVMLLYCWQLALLSFISVIGTILVTKVMSGKVRKFSREKQQHLGTLNGIVEETVTGYRTVVAYNYQKETIEDFNESSDFLTHAGIKADTLSGIMGPLMNTIGNLGFIIIAAFGGYFAMHGIISIGVISAFIVYAKQFSRPINELAQVYGSLQTAVAASERVFKIIDAPKDDKGGDEHMGEVKGSVRFDHVDFSYTPGKRVLSDFTIDIPAGSKVALVGSTGCGKTTVVNLLMRFYHPDSGHIYIDGKEISTIPTDELRNNMSIVLQDTVLFSDTILNNLKYGCENPSPEQVQKAMEISDCAEMVRTMPEGVDTLLSPSGTNLSQGERQLLAIARAFVADPKILILDEATSSVDTRTEKNIQRAMVNAMKDRTGIIIAHRLSTIRDADRIIVMDGGRIVESGTHDSLLAAKGRYYELYQTQFAGYEI